MVDDEAYIGLVDAHAKGDRRTDYLHLVADKFVLGFCSRVFVEAGMVARGVVPISLQLLDETLGVFTRKAIDNSTFTRMFAQQCEDGT